MPRPAASAPGDRPRRAPPPSTCRPASTGSSALTARSPRRCPRRWSRVSARAGRAGVDPAPTSPATAARRRGARRATGTGTELHGRASCSTRCWRWSAEGALPIVVDASSCTHGTARELGQFLSERDAERHAAARDPRLDRVGPRSAAPASCELRRQARRRRRAPAPARRPTSGSPDSSRRWRRRSPSRSRAARHDAAAESRATAACSTPSCPPPRSQDVAAELAGRRLDAYVCSQPHLRDRPRRTGPGGPTSRSCCCSRS